MDIILEIDILYVEVVRRMLSDGHTTCRVYEKLNEMVGLYRRKALFLKGFLVFSPRMRG